MVEEAERYKAEDDAQRDRIQAKNQLESYAFNMKSTMEDDKLKDKISAEDKKTVMDKCNEVLTWLDNNQVGWNLFDTILYNTIVQATWCDVCRDSLSPYSRM